MRNRLRDPSYDDYEIKDGDQTEPWWYDVTKDKLQEFINRFKYPLQKIYSEEQIISMIKMQGSIDKKEFGTRINKEKNYHQCESKKIKEKV